MFPNEREFRQVLWWMSTRVPFQLGIPQAPNINKEVCPEARPTRNQNLALITRSLVDELDRGRVS